MSGGETDIVVRGKQTFWALAIAMFGSLGVTIIRNGRRVVFNIHQTAREADKSSPSKALDRAVDECSAEVPHGDLCKRRLMHLSTT